MTARAARGDRVGRRLRLAATVAALGHRAGLRTFREMGIAVVRDLPAVGANLHDHFNSYVAWRATRAGTLNDLALSRAAQSFVRHANTRSADEPAFRHKHARRHPRAVRSSLRSPRPADEHLPVVDREARPPRHPCAQVAGFSISPVHLRPEGAAAVQPQAAIRWPRRGSSSSFSKPPTTSRPCSMASRLARRSRAAGAAALHRRGGPAAVRRDERRGARSRTCATAACLICTRSHLPHGAWADAVVDPRLRCTGSAASG